MFTAGLVVEPERVFAAFLDALVAPGAFGSAGAAATPAERIRLQFDLRGGHDVHPFAMARKPSRSDCSATRMA